MRILHTADWHLGAYLGPFSRTDEQKLFLDQLYQIVDDYEADMIIVAGDIFDSANPSAAAEHLYFSAMTKLSAKKIPIVLVAGNHDSAERLSAPVPMLDELGVLVFSSPNTELANRKYEGFSVCSLAPGCIEVNIKGQTAVIAAMPFATEKRLNESIFTASDEAAMQSDYSAKIRELFERASGFFREDTVNIAIGHFHIAGGEGSKGLERDLQLGGSFAVRPSAMPPAGYIAMGHLHRPQRIKCGTDNEYSAVYAGSPLPYSLSEQGYPKSVSIVDIEPGTKANAQRVILNCPKPIELWEVATVSEALRKCAEPSNAYKYIRITEENYINPHDIKEMRRLAKDIVEIKIESEEVKRDSDFNEHQNLNPLEAFLKFYSKSKGAEPKDEVVSIFNEIISAKESQ